MKKIIYLVLLITLTSCFQESDQEKAGNSIQDQMYYKAKEACPDMESFSTFGQFYQSSINDSIVFCQQNYTYNNMCGKKEISKVYGYFNKRTAEDVTYSIDYYASSSEVSKVSSLIK